MTEESIKSRIATIEAFDKSIDKLVKEKKYFIEECKDAVNKENYAIKIYGLAFNFAWTIRYIIDVAQQYEEELRNSLLYDRFKKNTEYYKLIYDLSKEVDNFINKLSFSILIIITGNSVPTEGRPQEEIACYEEDKEYLLELSSNLIDNGDKILDIITFYLHCLLDILQNIKNIRLNRTPQEYGFLYEKEFNEYKNSEEWCNMNDSYIQTIIDGRHHGVEPETDELWSLYALEFDRITEIDAFKDIESVYNDNNKLGKYLVNKDIENSTSNPIMDLFMHKGKQLLLAEWIRQKEEEGISCCEPIDDQAVSDWEYSEKYSESKAKRTFPKIKALFKDRNAVDWVCFYHVLVFYTYISFYDFNVFTMWLNKISGESLISSGNSRVIKMQYWVKEAKKKWSFEELKKFRNSKQAETQFRDYINLCENIRTIINEG